MELFVSWIAACVGLLTVGVRLDSMLSADAKRAFSNKIAIALGSNPARWMQAMSTSFLILFDRIYGWRRSVVSKMLWRVIILCYGVFIIGRFILWGFGLAVPSTELILSASIYTAIGSILLLQSLRGLTSLTEAAEEGIPARLIVNRSLIISILCGMLLIAMIVLGSWLTFIWMDTSTRTAIAVSIGAAFSSALVVPIAIIPDYVHPINPLRAILSSLIFMFVIGFAGADSASSFLEAIGEGQLFLLSFIAFNVFGDVVSLVETRWILMKSQHVGTLAIIALLVFDILLSAGIYLTLPLIANQDLTVLMEALMFRGTMPWMGILFWTTFSTSAVFYLFVASVFLCRVFSPILRLLSRWINIGRHPVGTVTCAMAIISSAIFVLLAILT